MGSVVCVGGVWRHVELSTFDFRLSTFECTVVGVVGNLKVSRAVARTMVFVGALWARLCCVTRRLLLVPPSDAMGRN